MKDCLLECLAFFFHINATNYSFNHVHKHTHTHQKPLIYCTNERVTQNESVPMAVGLLVLFSLQVYIIFYKLCRYQRYCTHCESYQFPNQRRTTRRFIQLFREISAYLPACLHNIAIIIILWGAINHKLSVFLNN